MIGEINELKQAIKRKDPQIVVDRKILTNDITGTEYPWIDVGFEGWTDTIQTFNFFVMALFSSKWKQAYIKKKLFYKYRVIAREPDRIALKLK